ncbi:L-amino acid N-acyltransferase YncA [Marmoricola sp. OAE513]|uniref:GNAT family N-acetyltransferase n=1 Tax=Marmoricola sp. OAE513 TaxID=2817894 RepID=UPI001AE330C0
MNEEINGDLVAHTLPDGARITLRPLEPTDALAVREIFEHLSPTSRYQRFLAPKTHLTSADLRQLLSVDHCTHEAVIAFDERGVHPIGVARFIRGYGVHPEVAEIAVEVVDAWHWRGVGSALTAALVLRAYALEVLQFSAYVAHGNLGATSLMRRVPGRLGRVGSESGAAEYRLVLDPAC